MDVRQLRYFIAIAESKSLSEAARKVHIVQPALSKRLADLEAELGVQLIVRGRLGTALTAAGTELYNRARLITRHVEAATQAVKEHTGVVGGPVTIGVLRTLAPAVGARLFTAIKDRLPQVVPDIRVGYSAELQRMLREGRLDITMQLPQAIGREAAAYAERLCVVGRAELFHGLPAALEPEHLAEVPLLLPSLQPVHSLLLDLAGRQGIELDIVGGMEDTSSLLEICRTGRAATVMSEWAAGKARESHALQVRVLEHPDLIRTVTVVVNEDVPRTERVTVVEEVMLKVLEELQADSRHSISFGNGSSRKTN